MGIKSLALTLLCLQETFGVSVGISLRSSLSLSTKSDPVCVSSKSVENIPECYKIESTGMFEKGQTILQGSDGTRLVLREDGVLSLEDEVGKTLWSNGKSDQDCPGTAHGVDHFRVNEFGDMRVVCSDGSSVWGIVGWGNMYEYDLGIEEVYGQNKALVLRSLSIGWNTWFPYGSNDNIASSYQVLWDSFRPGSEFLQPDPHVFPVDVKEDYHLESHGILLSAEGFVGGPYTPNLTDEYSRKADLATHWALEPQEGVFPPKFWMRNRFTGNYLVLAGYYTPNFDSNYIGGVITSDGLSQNSCENRDDIVRTGLEGGECTYLKSTNKYDCGKVFTPKRVDLTETVCTVGSPTLVEFQSGGLRYPGESGDFLNIDNVIVEKATMYKRPDLVSKTGSTVVVDTGAVFASTVNYATSCMLEQAKDATVDYATSYLWDQALDAKETIPKLAVTLGNLATTWLSDRNNFKPEMEAIAEIRKIITPKYLSAGLMGLGIGFGILSTYLENEALENRLQQLEDDLRSEFDEKLQTLADAVTDAITNLADQTREDILQTKYQSISTVELRNFANKVLLTQSSVQDDFSNLFYVTFNLAKIENDPNNEQGFGGASISGVQETGDSSLQEVLNYLQLALTLGSPIAEMGDAMDTFIRNTGMPAASVSRTNNEWWDQIDVVGRIEMSMGFDTYVLAYSNLMLAVSHLVKTEALIRPVDTVGSDRSYYEMTTWDELDEYGNLIKQHKVRKEPLTRQSLQQRLESGSKVNFRDECEKLVFLDFEIDSRIVERARQIRAMREYLVVQRSQDFRLEYTLEDEVVPGGAGHSVTTNRKQFYVNVVDDLTGREYPSGWKFGEASEDPTHLPDFMTRHADKASLYLREIQKTMKQVTYRGGALSDFSDQDALNFVQKTYIDCYNLRPFQENFQTRTDFLDMVKSYGGLSLKK